MAPSRIGRDLFSVLKTHLPLNSKTKDSLKKEIRTESACECAFGMC